MTDSLYKVTDPLAVYCNPSGIYKLDSCEMAWATYKLLGVERRKRAKLDPGEKIDARDRGKVLHKFIDVAVSRYAKTGEVWAFEGAEGKLAAQDIFRHFSETEGVDGDEYSERELVEAAQWQIRNLGLEAFEVVELHGEPLVERDLTAVVDGLPMQAIVDAVLRHKRTGQVWVVDWKTSTDEIDTKKTLNFTIADKQLELQRLVLEAHGVHVDRAALVQVRSLKPQPPPKTSRGKVTRNLKLVACDADTYRQALLDNDEDITDPKVREKLKTLEASVFSRWLPDISTPEQRAQVRAELLNRARTMQAIARGERLPTMLLSNVSGHLRYVRGCDGCDYKTWCVRTLQNGGRPDFNLVGIDYKFNDKADPANKPDERTTARALTALYEDYCRDCGVEQPNPYAPFKP